MEKIVIPIAGGKGGVGKTLVCSGLSMALAELGRTTLAIDLDLGNSNLHSMLGLRNLYPGVGEYLHAQSGDLPHFLAATPFPCLRFLAGDGRMPFMANLTYSQKQKLIRELGAVDADYILVDLGAGSSFNTLDLFLIADSGILVTTPEYPSLFSLIVFIKNLVLRAVERAICRYPDLVPLLEELYTQPVHGPLFNMRRFRDRVGQASPEAAQEIERICRRLRPRIIYNMGDNPADLESLPSIDRTLDEILSMQADHFGYLFRDPAVPESVRRQKALLEYAPQCEAAQAIRQIARRIDLYWDQPIADSAQLLIEHTLGVYETRHPHP